MNHVQGYPLPWSSRYTGNGIERLFETHGALRFSCHSSRLTSSGAHQAARWASPAPSLPSLIWVCQCRQITSGAVLAPSSVKEYLTSHRLAAQSEDVSRYHILLKPAHHGILAQARVSVSLGLGDHVFSGRNRRGFSSHAICCWTLGFACPAWACLNVNFSSTKTSRVLVRGFFCTISTRSPTPAPSSPCLSLSMSQKSLPLLCCSQWILRSGKQIIDTYPYPRGGSYVTQLPVVAALAGQHFETAQLLRNHCADPNVQCYDEWTPLHAAV